MMRWIFCLFPALAALAAFSAAAAPSSTATTIRGVAEATALSEFCVHWSIDPASVAAYLHDRKISRDGRYRDIFAAYAKPHAENVPGGDFPAACERAISLYGPQGSVIAGLVRPVWNGACGDCRRHREIVRP